MYKLIVLEGGYEGLSAEGLDFEDLKEEIIFLEENGTGGCLYCDGDQGKPIWSSRGSLEYTISSSSTWEGLTLALILLFDAKEKEEGIISWTSDIWEDVEIIVERE